MKTDFDMSKLIRKMAAYMKATGKSMDSAVRDTAVLVVQSAAKLTPPGTSARIPKKLFTRPVQDILDSERGLPMGHKVRINATNRRARLEFMYRDYPSREECLEAAKDHAVITYRGISKAGWWAALAKFGVPDSGFNCSDAVTGKLSEINQMEIKPADESAGKSQVITVRNKVRSIARYGSIALHKAVGNANVRLGWALKKLKDEVKRAA